MLTKSNCLHDHEHKIFLTIKEKWKKKETTCTLQHTIINRVPLVNQFNPVVNGTFAVPIHWSP
jgi:hypothetical protein